MSIGRRALGKWLGPHLFICSSFRQVAPGSGRTVSMIKMTECLSSASTSLCSIMVAYGSLQSCKNCRSKYTFAPFIGCGVKKSCVMSLTLMSLWECFWACAIVSGRSCTKHSIDGYFRATAMLSRNRLSHNILPGGVAWDIGARGLLIPRLSK